MNINVLSYLFDGYTLYSTSSESPVFVILRAGKNAPFWLFLVQQTTAKIMVALNIQPSPFTFHSFRRRGATSCFNNNVTIEDILLHGSWNSDTIHTYLQ